ncbi:hypothetical protein [Anaeromyxobacter dehalogenans]|uniref:hypothetical protein n=1 Tax=Anaeromyxobacter dehalogenans TaxID=161493 RepID=UPI00059D63D7|nr:hypothetical protein [Anaeromyxobacter dehalogenans]
MTNVDTQLRSDILTSVAGFRAPASEPIWSERSDSAGNGPDLVLYITDKKAHFGTRGSFWVHALFGFLEDRLEPEALAESAAASLCREMTIGEVLQAVEGRIGRPLDHAERETMRLAEHRPEERVFGMLASQEYFAALIEADDRYIGVFVAEGNLVSRE